MAINKWVTCKSTSCTVVDNKLWVTSFVILINYHNYTCHVKCHLTLIVVLVRFSNKSIHNVSLKYQLI